MARPIPCDSEQLDRYLSELYRIFQSAGCKHEAHTRSKPVLEDIAADRDFLTRVMQLYISTPGVFNRKNYPVVGIDIELNAHFHLVANCWIPLPGRPMNISSKSIHHHGNMLLTTLNIFGPGYEHWLFTKPQPLDPQRELYDLRVTVRERHGLHNIAFVDAWEPHLPVYPGSLTITLCLWSNQHPTTWKDRVKRIPLLKQREASLRHWAERMGFAAQLDLKVVKYFDFYPTEEGFKGMRERMEFTLGPNEDHLHSVFHALQGSGNEALAPLIDRQLEAGIRFQNPALVKSLVRDLQHGTPIEGRLSDCHLDIPYATFTTEAIERAMTALEARSAVGAGAPDGG